MRIVVKSGEMIVLSRDHLSPRLAIDAQVSGDQPPPTDMDNISSQELMDLCDAFWEQLSKPQTGSFAGAFTPEARSQYKDYVNAVNELSTRGREILGWAMSRLTHPEYDAREQAAFLIGQLGARHQLGEQLSMAIDQLSQLAVRPVEEDGKETQANSAAIMALGNIGHPSGLHALRHIIMAREWSREEALQWDAADALGKIVGESSVDRNDRVSAACEWLNAHPEA